MITKLDAWMAAALTMFTVMSSPGFAQERSLPPDLGGVQRTAIIATLDSFPYHGTDAVLIRRANSSPHDLLVIRRSAVSSELVAEALFTLEAAWERYGAIPETDALIRVRAPGPARPRAREAGEWADRLVRQAPSALAGLGNVPHVRVQLRGSAVRVAQPR